MDMNMLENDEKVEWDEKEDHTDQQLIRTRE